MGMEADKGILDTALLSVTLICVDFKTKTGTCSLVCRDPLTFLPDKSQCGCTAQTGRDSAVQGSRHKKEVIEFLVDLMKSSNGK